MGIEHWRPPAGTSRLLSAAAVMLLAAALLAACELPTRFFVVDSTDDAVDSAPGDGTCAAASGECTLRAAISEANALDEFVDITLAPGATYTITRSGIDDTNANGDLDVLTPVTINGSGSTIDADHRDRIFDTIGADSHVTIVNLTLTRGATSSSGGAVRGSITAVRSTIHDNQASGFTGCAWIGEAPGGEPVICVFEGFGGGAVAGSLVAIGSTISNNRSLHSGYGCTTGVIEEPDPVPITSCSAAGGGAVTGTAVLLGSTLSGNTAATGQGHAVLGNVMSTWSTLVDGSTGGTTIAGGAEFGATLVQSGGAVACAAYPPIGGAIPPIGPDNGVFTSVGYNLSNVGGCGLTDPTDLPSTPYVLGPLADNGGTTRTHLPAGGGPGIDLMPALTPQLCAIDGLIDQRWLARPEGTGCDVGSVERHPTDP